MEFIQANIQRVFVLRIDHEEDLLEQLEAFVAKQNIRSAVAYFLGALSEGRMVTGPEELAVPPERHWESFSDGREVLGMATIFTNGDEPEIHAHAVVGRGKEAWAGCLRERAKVYLLVEALVVELDCPFAARAIDPRMGISMLRLRASES